MPRLHNSGGSGGWVLQDHGGTPHLPQIRRANVEAQARVVFEEADEECDSIIKQVKGIASSISLSEQSGCSQ